MDTVWGNSSFAMLGVFAARRGVARMYRRIFRVLFAVSVLGLTSGCETVSGILAELFGDSPVAAAEPEPQAPKLADRIVVRKDRKSTRLNSSHSQISYA